MVREDDAAADAAHRDDFGGEFGEEGGGVGICGVDDFGGEEGAAVGGDGPGSGFVWGCCGLDGEYGGVGLQVDVALG